MTYGTATGTLYAGSGGCGTNEGGVGGGLVHVQTAANIVHYGTISANGAKGRSYCGGGSGGGIWLECRNLLGSGKIYAKGGTKQSGNPGGGGGGRVIIRTWKDLLTGEQPGTYIEYVGSTNGTVSVTGGAGYGNGTNGTFHLKLLKTRTVFTIY